MADKSKSRKRKSVPVDTHIKVLSPSPSPPTPPMPRPTYNTRLSMKQPPPLNKLQVAHAPLSPTKAQTSFPASSAAGQYSFLREVGMVTTAVEPLEDILTDDEAELLSCSLKHQRYDDSEASVYFTPEQRERQIEKKVSLVKGAKRLLKTAKQGLNTDTWDSEEKLWQEEEERNVICCCKAHECDDAELYMAVLGRLVMVAPPLTDDTGNVLATVLLSHIIKKSGLNQLYVQSSRTGTMASVRYLLRCPSGTEYIYTGWPDFQVSYMFGQAERRRLGKGVDKVEETVRAIGEIQSPPEDSTDAKNRSFAQAGIYTLGHFCNTNTIERLATVVLYKDMTVHVALATIARGGSGDTVGDVTYKPVYSLHPFNLQNPCDMALFASVFVATLKSTIFK